MWTPTLLWQYLYLIPLINTNNCSFLFSLNKTKQKKKRERGKNQFNSGFSTSSYHFPSQLAGGEFQLTGRSPREARLPVFLLVMPHNCRGTCIFQPMTRLTKIDTPSYLIKEPKPVTPVQVPNNMRVSEIVFRSQTVQAYYSTEPSHVGGEKNKKKNKKRGGGREQHHMQASLFQNLLF